MNAVTRPDPLRQMLAVLQAERRALAGLDLAAIADCATQKARLCDRLEAAGAGADTGETRELLARARLQNEANRRLRNLIAGKIAARLIALTGRPALYRIDRSPHAG